MEYVKVIDLCSLTYNESQTVDSIIFKGVGFGKEPDKNLESTGIVFIKDLPGLMIKSEPEEGDIIGTITVVTNPSLQKLDDEESPTGGPKDKENKALDEHSTRDKESPTGGPKDRKNKVLDEHSTRDESQTTKAWSQLRMIKVFNLTLISCQC